MITRLVSFLGIFAAFGLLTSPVVAAVSLSARDDDQASRLIFRWSEPVQYNAAVEGNDLVLRFQSDEQFQFDPSQFKPLARISDLRLIQASSDEAELRFGLAQDARLRHYRAGKRIIVDILAAPEREKAQPFELVLSEEGDIPIPSDGVLPETVKRQLERVVEVETKRPVLLPPQPEIPPRDAPESQKPETNTPEVFAPDLSARTVLPVEITREDEDILVRYDWDKQVAAAVFQRAGKVWVLFDEQVRLDHQVSQDAALIIGDARPVFVPDATLAIYPVEAGYMAEVRQDGTGWLVRLKPRRVEPRRQIEIQAQQAAREGNRFFVPLEPVTAPVRVDDPIVGDTLFIVPVRPQSYGVIDDRKLAQVHFLETAQGLVIAPQADDVLVERFRNGILIGHEEGLIASSDQIDDLAQNDAVAGDVKPVQLIDFPAWRRGDLGAYPDARRELLYRLATAPDHELQDRRWDLARFYTAHDLAGAAEGVLGLMHQLDPKLDERVEYRTLRGLVRLSLNRPLDALEDLEDDILDDEPDINLWRALAASELGMPSEVLKQFAAGADVVSQYEPHQQARFQLAAASAAIETGDLATAERELEYLQSLDLNRAVQDEIRYFQSALDVAHGAEDLALSTFKELAQSENRKTAARAIYDDVNLRLKRDLLPINEAIEQLERLRFAWRGDDFELKLLKRLGQLYVDEGDYRTGLATWRQAVSYFPSSPETRAISKTMQAVFRDLFLTENMKMSSPVKALALYYDFRELTPLGADGDAMIRKLADRLVAVDLLDRAAGLLEHQIKYRLDGTAQASVAMRLAMIHQLNSDPKEAIRVLRVTRQAVMPDDLIDARNRVEARALIDLERYEEAEAAIEGDRSEDALTISADIFWNRQDWNAVISNAEERLAGLNAQSTLDTDMRRQLLRYAIALNMLEDEVGLADLRARFNPAMAGGELADTFDVITQSDTGSGRLRAASQDIASIARLESFMESYRAAFASDVGEAGL
ncbi:MAG: hypothetical protein AAGF15_10995 [Pseudomonadota bacterium]